jgi:hypothetical protein
MGKIILPKMVVYLIGAGAIQAVIVVSIETFEGE